MKPKYSPFNDQVDTVSVTNLQLGKIVSILAIFRSILSQDKDKSQATLTNSKFRQIDITSHNYACDLLVGWFTSKNV